MIKSSKVNNRKREIKKSVDTIYMDTDELYSVNRNNGKEITPNIKNIVVSKEMIEEENNYIEIHNTSANNFSIDGFKNYSGISIPIDFFCDEDVNLYIENKNNKKLEFKTINIIKDNLVLLEIFIDFNYNSIQIESNCTDDLNISLNSDKKIIEYDVNKNGKYKKEYIRYKIDENDLDTNFNLDIRDILKYEYIVLEKFFINTLIVDKSIFNNIKKLHSFNFNIKNKSMIKSIRFIDDNIMKLIPFDKTFLINKILLGENDKFLYIKTYDDEVVIYLDENDKLNYISKNDLLSDKDIERVYFRFRNFSNLNGSLRPLNFIIKTYKDGTIKVFDLNKEYVINDDFKNEINFKIEECLRVGISEFRDYIKNDDWLKLLNSEYFSNSILKKITTVYEESLKLRKEAEDLGLSKNAIDYLKYREMLEKIVKMKLYEEEINSFNTLGESYKKMLKRW